MRLSTINCKEKPSVLSFLFCNIPAVFRGHIIYLIKDFWSTVEQGFFFKTVQNYRFDLMKVIMIIGIYHAF